MDKAMKQYYQGMQNAAIGGGVLGAEQDSVREPEVTAQISMLSREAAEISACIDSIEAKFGRVLQPSAPSAGANACGVPYYTALGGEIGEIVERLRTSRQRLESILIRAEL